jgi:RNA polymerase sigma-70 factor (ECF subfamily)
MRFIQTKRPEGNLKAEFLKYSPMVFSVALGILKSREEAEDVVQDVFTHKVPKILRERDDWPEAQLGALLCRIARNHSIDLYRRRKFQTPDEPTEAVLNSFSTDDGDEYGSSFHSQPLGREAYKTVPLEEALETLEPRYREVLTLKYLMKWGWVEVAEKLGLSQQGARKRADKAKLLLREKLVPPLEEDV